MMVHGAGQKHGRVWTAESLCTWLSSVYGGQSIVVLANREPFRHERERDGTVAVRRASGGLVTALEPLIEACSGVWVAHGAGTADRVSVDCRDGVAVPPSNPRYRLRRVWLDAHEERAYYYGFSNQGLWPLCHRTEVLPVFRPGDFEVYRSINLRFAQAACEEAAGDTPVILVQDYHLALAPRAIRDRFPRSTIVAFWHIPWPAPTDFALCAWGRQLLAGLTASTIVGLQTPDDCRNFLDTVEAFLNARVDRARGIVTHAGLTTTVRAYPVSIEYPDRNAGECPPAETCRRAIRERLHLAPDVRLGIGVDRLDYTKGIAEKFLAVERLLELHPEHEGRFVFVQIAEPSRIRLPEYQELAFTIRETAARINLRFGAGDYRPIILLEARHEPAEVYRYLRAADLCYVGSLHDGMNLVAKEFVSAREDHRGVLVLSEFAGAARQLSAALIVNPYAIADAARALHDALTMTDEEQAARMHAMRATVAEFNAYRWAGEMLADAAQLRIGSAADRDHVQPRHDAPAGLRSSSEVMAARPVPRAS